MAGDWLDRLSMEVCLLPDPVDPLTQLAREAAAFETLPVDTCRVMIWRSAPSVVIGKNQNPWRECDVDRIEADGGTWARRQSGGGAVYHDPGNVCYSLMTPKTNYCPDQVGEVICSGLRPLGIPARVGDRHVLEVAGRKISGTAFCHRRDRVLHHGTLLVSSDLPRLRRWLTPSLPGLQTRAVASVPSPVANLADVCRGLTPDLVIQALCQRFARAIPFLPPAAETQAQYTRFSQLDWRLGLTPPFFMPMQDGSFSVRKGRLVDVPPSCEALRDTWFHPRILHAS